MNDLSAIILCGGKGLRLRPLTNDIPKPLIPINDKPILYYIVSHLIKYKINKIIIATGYKSKMIEKFMLDNFSFIDYTIVDSGDVNIIARIKDSLKHIDNDFILCYGDTISNIDLNKLIEFHKKKSDSVTITSYPISIPFGVMKIDNKNYVESFEEKPTLTEVMNIGYYYFPNNKFDLIKKKKSIIDILKHLISKRLLRCYKHKKIHITVNTISELEYAEKDIKKIL